MMLGHFNSSALPPLLVWSWTNLCC